MLHILGHLTEGWHKANTVISAIPSCFFLHCNVRSALHTSWRGLGQRSLKAGRASSRTAPPRRAAPQGRRGSAAPLGAARSSAFRARGNFESPILLGWVALPIPTSALPILPSVGPGGAARAPDGRRAARPTPQRAATSSSGGLFPRRSLK